MSNIALSGSIHSVLSGLKSTSEMMDVVQKRLATGKKVSSAIDDPAAYFTSQALYSRANDLTSIKENIATASAVVKAATDALDGIEKILKQMKGLAEQAKASSDATERGTYGTQYDALRDQLDSLTDDASFNGVNLLKATPDDLTVSFNEDGSATMTVDGIASDSAGLSVTANNDWDNATLATGATNIDGDLTKITDAMTTVRTSAATLGASAAVLKIRMDFTSTLINTLKSGGDNMTNADGNEEAANMLALQSRQALAMQSLSIANQTEQSILTLFR